MAVRTAAARSTFAGADVALILSLALMWGLSFLFIKVAVDDVGPAWVVAGRTSVGAAVLLAILGVRRQPLPRSAAIWRHLTIIGLLSNLFPWLLLAWAEQHLSSGLASVLMALVPTMTLAVAVGVGVERLTGYRVVGLIMALGGTTLAVWREIGADGALVPALGVVLATLLYGIGAVYAKQHVSGRLPALAVATGQVLVAAVIATTSALLLAGTPTGLQVDSAGSLLGLGALGTGLAFLVFYQLLDRVGPTSATLVTYLIPIVGLTAGAVVLGEQFGWNVIAGLAVIIAGIWMAQRETLPGQPPPASGPEPELEVLVTDA